MRNVAVIAWYDIKRVLRERESLFWLFVGPLIFTVFFGLLFRPGEQDKPRLAVVNRDVSEDVASGIGPSLQQDGVTVTRMAGVERGRLTLEIPDGAAAALREGKDAAFTLHAGVEESDSERNTRFKI
jgi:hypothetical protein